MSLQPEPILEDERYDPAVRFPALVDPIPNIPISQDDLEAWKERVNSHTEKLISEFRCEIYGRDERPTPGSRITLLLNLALDLLNLRLLLLICIVASAGLFFMAGADPDPWRLTTAVAFSLIVTGPMIYFYRRAE